MTSSNFSTTRHLTPEKPACFDTLSSSSQTLLKVPDSDSKIAEGGLRLQGQFKTSSGDKPLITVVTVVYNGAECLEDTIKSVIGQSYENVEYIVVDGASTDGTLDLIRKYEHVIDYWVSEPDKGIYDAMNKGIKLGSGQWINFMNSGDEFYKNNVLSDIKKNLIDCSVVYGGVQLVFNDNLKKVLSPPNDIKFGYGLPFNHQSALVRSDLLKKYLFDKKYKILGDAVFFYKIFTLRYEFKPVRKIIASYNCNGASSTISIDYLREKYLFGLMVMGFKKNFLHFSIHFINIIFRSLMKYILPSKAIDFFRK